ncbi:MAG: hypothetical protein U0586_16870 [Candidatus Brocadiaceae bacterium]
MKLSILKKFLIVFGFSLLIVASIKPGVYANEKCVKPCYADRCYYGTFDCAFLCGMEFFSVCFDKNGDLLDEADGTSIIDVQKGETCYIITIGDTNSKIELRLRFLGCNGNPCSKLIGTLRFFQDCKEVARCCIKGYEVTTVDSAAPQGIAQGLNSALKNLYLRLK